MKKTLIITTLLFSIFVSCKQESKVETKFEKLSKFYNDTTFSELFVYPNKSNDDALFVFKGKQIDTTVFHLLTEKVTQGLPWTEGFYGIYSFNINSEHVGLITRTPGAYSPTKISLWIYDLKNDSITNNIELADIFGDAGTALRINSYLFLDKEKQLNALTYRFYSYDHSVEGEADMTIEKHNHYYLTKIKYLSVDTISTDSAMLNQEFKQLIKMANY